MKKQYPITGTFIDEITYDIPASNWSNKQWKADFDNMKKLGMDTLIITRGVFYDKCVYPSRHFQTLKEPNEDFAGFIFEEAAKRGMKVYMGLAISNLTWNDGDAAGELELNKRFVPEVLERYGDMPSFAGWYVPHETCDDVYNIKDVMGGLAAYCKDKTPDKKVIISPFFRGSPIDEKNPRSAEATGDVWNDIWEKMGKDIDVCAFQDGTASLEEYPQYLAVMQKVCKAHEISLWSNVETFERDVRHMFLAIPFDVLRRKIELAKPYVEKQITFEFSHFLSPQSIFQSAKNLNALYREYYGKKR